jgi:hypothetical protein
MINVVTNMKYHIRNQIISQTITRLRVRVSYKIRRKVDILVLEQVADELRRRITEFTFEELYRRMMSPNKRKIT